MSDGGIQVHPQAQRLINENAILREQVVGLLAELDALLTTVKPNLLAIYQTRIGPWELSLLKAQFEIARLKRKIELIQASVNHAVRPDLQQVEAQVASECIAWEVRVKEAAERITAAESRLQNFLSLQEAAELRDLYRALVKKLHPDVNRQLTAEQSRLWQRVQTAHSRADLTELRALSLLADKLMPPRAGPSSLETLQKEQKALADQIDSLLKRIKEAEGRPPFTLRQQLQDSAWLDCRRLELEAQIEQLAAHRLALESHLHQLLPDNENGKWFNQN